MRCDAINVTGSQQTFSFFLQGYSDRFLFSWLLRPFPGLLDIFLFSYARICAHRRQRMSSLCLFRHSHAIHYFGRERQSAPGRGPRLEGVGSSSAVWVKKSPGPVQNMAQSSMKSLLGRLGKNLSPVSWWRLLGSERSALMPSCRASSWLTAPCCIRLFVSHCRQVRVPGWICASRGLHTGFIRVRKRERRHQVKWNAKLCTGPWTKVPGQAIVACG